MNPDRSPAPAWSFTGYERIAESLERWIGDDEAAYRALAHAEWIVTEKIHGANFCLATDGVEIRAARTAPVGGLSARHRGAARRGHLQGRAPAAR